MNFKKYYRNNITYVTKIEDRLKLVIRHVLNLNPNNILDIGCGNGLLINELLKQGYKGKCYGTDVYVSKSVGNYEYKVSDITDGLPYSSLKFDCVILGEVVEHIPNTDNLLREIYRVLRKDGYLIITTPNLVCWFNRIIVPLGIQPLFTETSSEIKLGRIWPSLGQGKKSEGHLKIFTHRSLQEILEYVGFKVISKQGLLFYFPFPLSMVDKIFVNFLPFSSGLLYVAKKNI